MARGRKPVLTDTAACCIRAFCKKHDRNGGLNESDFANAFGVSHGTISNIITGKTYTHLPMDAEGCLVRRLREVG